MLFLWPMGVKQLFLDIRFWNNIFLHPIIIIIIIIMHILGIKFQYLILI